jgi:alpha-tubulin suppressor-like RCC1 family protein
LGITSAGALFVWGDNKYNQLGQNDFITVPRSSPVQVGTSSWTKVSAGGYHSLAIRNDGALFGWGRNGQGQVTQNIALSWASVSSGVSYNIALRNDGALFGWGLNNKGQLGLSDTVNRSFPVQITTQSNSLYYSYYFGGSGGPHFSIADNAAFARLPSIYQTDKLSIWRGYFNTRIK